MPRYERNVRLDVAGRRRGWLERVLLGNPVVNRVMSWSGQIVLTGLVWPRWVAPYRWELTRHEMPLVGLDGAFEGYRILQLTDLHVGKTRVSYLQRAIGKCLEEKPELVVITGDLIDYHPRSLKVLMPVLRQIVAGAGADGVCAIFGNHDYGEYSWRHVGARSARRGVHRRLVGMVQEAGIRLLRNERMRLVRPAASGGEAGFTVVGMDEMWTGLANAGVAFGGIEGGEPVICLQHNPDGVEFLMPYGWQWMLCGHSHGGQGRFPFLGALYVPMVHREYLSGFFRFAGEEGGRERVMFVSRGLGYSTPIRLRCRPEATVFTLRVVN